VGYVVEVRNVDGLVTALGSAGPHTVVVDRPVEAGGQGRGFNGGELLHLAVAGCVSIVEHVDRIAEIPESLRRGTAVRLRQTLTRRVPA
jgi:uncharacterized OsmC-like protein